jgi:hypothetical protein
MARRLRLMITRTSDEAMKVGNQVKVVQRAYDYTCIQYTSTLSNSVPIRRGRSSLPQSRATQNDGDINTVCASLNKEKKQQQIRNKGVKAYDQRG